MTDTSGQDDGRATERRAVRDIRRALIFGVVAATAQMAVLLWLLYG